MAQFSFIELSFDPMVTSEKDMQWQLRRLGFKHRSQHAMDIVGIWSHNQCILMVRRDSIADDPRITGLGFLGKFEDINRTNAEFDRTSDFFVCDNTEGFKTYIVQENQLNESIEDVYKPIDTTNSVNAFGSFSGIILNLNSNSLRDHYQELGFRMTKNSDKYDTLVGEGNNFTIMCSKLPKQSIVPTIVIDTQDVFRATAWAVTQGFDIPTFEQQDLTFGKLNHKIKGYNCKAWGNETSYTIENFIPAVANNIDIIVRQRSKYIHILEETVDSYYEYEHRDQ